MLITNAILIQRCLSDKESTAGVRLLSEREQLVQAYWNGLLDEILQKNVQQTKCCEKLFIEHLHRKESSLQIMLSDFNSF